MTTAALIIDNRTTAERWAQHARVVASNASTWVLGIGGALATYLQAQWVGMSAGQQTGLLASFGVTSPATLTAALTVITLVVRALPARRGVVTPATAEALERLAAEQANARLIAQGQPPLALTTPKLIAITHDQLNAAQAQTRTEPVDPDDEDYPSTKQAPVAPTAPPAPAASVPAPPMPGTAVMGDMTKFFAQPLRPAPTSPLPATTDTAPDLAQRLRAANIGLNDTQILLAVEALQRAP